MSLQPETIYLFDKDHISITTSDACPGSLVLVRLVGDASAEAVMTRVHGLEFVATGMSMSER